MLAAVPLALRGRRGFVVVARKGACAGPSPVDLSSCAGWSVDELIEKEDTGTGRASWPWSLTKTGDMQTRMQDMPY